MPNQSSKTFLFAVRLPINWRGKITGKKIRKALSEVYGYDLDNTEEQCITPKAKKVYNKKRCNTPEDVIHPPAKEKWDTSEHAWMYK